MIKRPYRRNHRGNRDVILHPKYAEDAQNYVRAAELIHKDLMEVFDYIEPSDSNVLAYSFRVHELLMRTCIEIEANCKAILRENGYAKAGGRNWTIEDYSKVNKSHRLSAYQIKVPVWKGVHSIRSPFEAWEQPNGHLSWYRAYNETKHDRSQQFEKANLGNLVEAVCGLVVLQVAQFLDEDFQHRHSYLVTEGPKDGFGLNILDYYRVAVPSDWPPEEKYSFSWKALEDEPDPFVNFRYP